MSSIFKISKSFQKKIHKHNIQNRLSTISSIVKNASLEEIRRRIQEVEEKIKGTDEGDILSGALEIELSKLKEQEKKESVSLPIQQPTFNEPAKDKSSFLDKIKIKEMQGVLKSTAEKLYQYYSPYKENPGVDKYLKDLATIKSIQADGIWGNETSQSLNKIKNAFSYFGISDKIPTENLITSVLDPSELDNVLETNSELLHSVFQVYNKFGEYSSEKETEGMGINRLNMIKGAVRAASEKYFQSEIVDKLYYAIFSTRPDESFKDLKEKIKKDNLIPNIDSMDYNSVIKYIRDTEFKE
jgi:hypothetical protein